MDNVVRHEKSRRSTDGNRYIQGDHNNTKPCSSWEIFKLESKQMRDICEISGSHGGEYEAQSLLGCTDRFDYTAVYPRRL
jgi:hypothetical protein